jgi:hypothetical protein
MLTVMLHRRRTPGTSAGNRTLLALAGASGVALSGGILLVLIG